MGIDTCLIPGLAVAPVHENAKGPVEGQFSTKGSWQAEFWIHLISDLKPKVFKGFPPSRSSLVSAHHLQEPEDSEECRISPTGARTARTLGT